MLDAIGEQAEADLVAIVSGAEGEDGGDFGGALAFGILATTIVAGAGDIDEEHDGEFAFLDVFADVGVVHAGGDVPVEEANIVTGLILAEVIELDALAFETGVVSTAEGFLDQAAGEEFDTPDPFEDAGEPSVVVFLSGWGHEGVVKVGMKEGSNGKWQRMRYGEGGRVDSGGG